LLIQCEFDVLFVFFRKQQKTRKVVEAVHRDLLSVAEDSSEHYMDVDLTEYSSSSQQVVPQQSRQSDEQQSLPKLVAEVLPRSESAENQSGDVADKVDLPEGL